MDVEKNTDNPSASQPKLHVWSQILLEDELSEKLASTMNAWGGARSKEKSLGFNGKNNKRNKKRNKRRNRKNKNKEEEDTKQVSSVDNPSRAQLPSTSATPVKSSSSFIPLSITSKTKFGGSLTNGKDLIKTGLNLNSINTNGESSHVKSVKPVVAQWKKVPYQILKNETLLIAKKLNNEKRTDIIMRFIRFYGFDEAWKLCTDVLTIEEAGGLMTLNSARRRTPGGVYFHLIRSSGRYESSIVEKIFKDNAEKTEPIFKRRNKFKSQANNKKDDQQVAPIGSSQISQDAQMDPEESVSDKKPTLQTFESKKIEQIAQEDSKIGLNLTNSLVASSTSFIDTKCTDFIKSEPGTSACSTMDQIVNMSTSQVSINA